MPVVQKITPCLWFDNQAEEAAKFYTGIFKNSKIGAFPATAEAGREIHGKPPGSVMVVEFELDGQTFTALNGGPMFKFNEAISFQVNCDTQEEVDYYWEQAVRGRGQERAAVRLAQGQIRRFLASRSQRHGRDDDRTRSGKIPESLARRCCR